MACSIQNSKTLWLERYSSYFFIEHKIGENIFTIKTTGKKTLKIPFNVKSHLMIKNSPRAKSS